MSSRTLACAMVLVACGEPSKPPSAPADPAPTVSIAPPPSPPAPGSASPTPATSCEGPSPGPGYECLQACGPPVARAGDPPPPHHWLSPDQVRARKMGGCPRCLRRGTKIATPAGDVAVERLHVGDAVFTTNAAGRRVAGIVHLVGSTAAPPDHRMVRIRLADGRSVIASPGHPTADGRGVGALAAGATLDHGQVAAVETLRLEDDRTFDLRPDGETGHYWAEGVLLGSTLSR